MAAITPWSLLLVMGSPRSAGGRVANSEWSRGVHRPSLLIFARRYSLLAPPSSAHVERRERGHVDELGVVGRERHDLHRAVEPDQDRTDHGRATQLLQQLGRNRGGMECRHDQHVGWPRQATERVGLA